MTTAEVARRGYAATSRSIQSPRATEYEAVSRVTHHLRRAALTRAADYPGFVSALAENRRLWVAFATDVAQPENRLPQALRARIFWLAEFTELETRRILDGSGDVAALIDVNTALLKGLSPGETAA